MSVNTRVNLFDYDLPHLQALLLEWGEPKFRAEQVLKWIHQQGVTDFDEMSNLSKVFRQKLKDKAEIFIPEVAFHQKSKDGTQKWLLRMRCGNSIETVFIPEGERGTLCISSQIGCALNCSFCSTATQGFNRDLSTGEIISQVWFAVRALSEKNGAHDHHVTNVVLMGMGEPLVNFDNVLAALNLMLDDFAYGLSKRRVTLSTSGLVPEMEKLKALSPVSLAVSLHAPNNALRELLVPLNKKYPLEKLIPVCKTYFENEARRRVTFEYVMLNEVNDKPEHAMQLVKLLHNVPAKVNLIPFNTFPGTQFTCSTPKRLERFRNILLNAGINAITRKTRGDDIDAACGQLVGKVQDKTKRSQRIHLIRDKNQAQLQALQDS